MSAGSGAAVGPGPALTPPRRLVLAHPAGGRARTHLVRLGTAALVGALVLVGQVLAMSPASAQETVLEIELSEVSPAVLRPGEDLVIRGTITNTGDEPSEPTVRLLLQRNVPATIDALGSWTDGSSISNTTPLTGWQGLEATLPAGGSAPFELQLSMDGTFSELVPWGPRGIEVQVRNDPATSPGDSGFVSARSTISWFPSESPIAAPTELTVLVPMTPTVAEWRVALADERPVGDVAAERLISVLDATGSRVSLAIDPVLLETTAPGVTPVLGDEGEEATPEPTTDPTTEPESSQTESGQSNDGGSAEETGADEESERTGDPPSDSEDVAGTGSPSPTSSASATAVQGGEDATTAPSVEPTDTSTEAPTEDPVPPVDQAALLARIVAASAEQDVIALPYADADLAALADHGAQTLWDAASDRAAELFARAGVAILDDVAWPAGALTAPGLQVLAGAGTTAVIVEEAGPAMVTDSRGEVAADDLVLDSMVIDPHLGDELARPGESVSTRQQLLALTALLTRTGTSAGGGLLAALPRDVNGEVLVGLADRLDALADSPWLQLVNLRNLRGRPDPGSPATELGDRTTGQHEITADELAAIREDSALVGALAQASDPDLAWAHQPSLLLPLSRTWRRAPDLRSDLLASLGVQMDALRGAISIETGSTVNLVAAESALAVTVNNDLPYPATVYLSLQPDSQALRASDPAPQELGAGAATTIRVPVTAVGSGDVAVGVAVRAEPDGVALAAPATFEVRVRADWENIGTAVIAGLLGVAFVIGLIRTIRKGGRRRVVSG